jgi:beta-galactosidase/beta-glucuronidase
VILARAVTTEEAALVAYAEAPESVHPRPQLTRARWVDLGGTWDFAHDDDGVGVDAGWPSGSDVFSAQIEVPYPPESPLSGVGDRSFHPVVWYRRTFSWPANGTERLLLHFGAVDYRATVWLNGVVVARHEGGHTPFSADVTPVLATDGEQVLVVRAEDRPGDVTQPRGKQDWQLEPHSVFYERTTGIWQPVWLEPVPAAHVTRLRWTPDIDRAVLGIGIECSDAAVGLTVRVELSLHGAPLASDTYVVTGNRLDRDVALNRAALTLERRRTMWAPEHPNLVDAVVTLLHGDTVVDQVRSYTALRSVRTSGGRFLLNGRPYYLRMVLEQGYWPQSHLAAPSGDALRREVELIKSLGFNGVRIHQKIEDPRFLHWCDRLGLVAWGEMPSAYEYSRQTVERLTREWLEVLDRDYSVPSIIAWVPLNESWGVPTLERDPAQREFVRALYHLTKALDPTRLTIGNDGWEHTLSDLFTIHDYSADPATLRERYGSHEAVERTLRQVQPYYRSVVLPGFERHDEPLMVTEFGGLTYAPGTEDFWNGYGTVAEPDELLKTYTEMVTALLDSPVIAGFCYTQLTDTRQERNGLVDEQRRPKVDVRRVRDATTRLPAAIPGDAIANVQLLSVDPATRSDAGHFDG